MRIKPRVVQCDYCERDLEDISDKTVPEDLTKFWSSAEEDLETFLFCDDVCKRLWSLKHLSEASVLRNSQPKNRTNTKENRV